MTSTGFTVFSWNVNGLSTINISDALKQLDCSILAIQETNLSMNALKQEVALIDHFTSYFSFCENIPGYSGVATYCKDDFMPVKSEEGLSGLKNTKYSKNTETLIGSYGHLEDSEKLNAMLVDNMGRNVLTQHLVQTPSGERNLLTVINVNSPRFNDVPDSVENIDFKLTFHTTLGKRAKSLVEAGSFVIIVGNLNMSHKPIDRAEAEDSKIFSDNIFRKWMDELLSDGFQDTFRMLHPKLNHGFSCWRRVNNARQNNCGSRFDYIIVDNNLAEYLEKAEIHSDILGIHHDHCPVSATFHSLIPVASMRTPPDATKYYPEFIRKKTNLKGFLVPFNNNKISEELSSSQKSVNQRSNKSVPTKNKRNVPTGGKQIDITSFFVKKTKTEGETEVPVQKVTESQTENGVDKSNNNTKTSFSSEVLANSGRRFWEMYQPHTRMRLYIPKFPPVCAWHNEPSILCVVKKEGMNQGKKYWGCSRGVGKANDPSARCNSFIWVNTEL